MLTKARFKLTFFIHITLKCQLPSLLRSKQEVLIFKTVKLRWNTMIYTAPKWFFAGSGNFTLMCCDVRTKQEIYLTYDFQNK